MTRWDQAGIAGLVLIFGPLVIVLAAICIDVCSWALTGHEVFPWIGHALNSGSNP